jgi:hypothetical protein
VYGSAEPETECRDDRPKALPKSSYADRAVTYGSIEDDGGPDEDDEDSRARSSRNKRQNDEPEVFQTGGRQSEGKLRGAQEARPDRSENPERVLDSEAARVERKGLSRSSHRRNVRVRT